LFGSPFWGFLSNKFQLTLYSPLAGIFLCLTGFLMLLYIDLSSLTLSIVFFLLGFGSAAQILSYSTVAKFNEKNTIGTAEALVTWLILGLGGMAQPLAGWLIQQRISLLSNESHVFTILIFVLMGTLVISGVLYYKLTRTEISGRNSLNISLVK
jgi:sugar phosphate permease